MAKSKVIVRQEDNELFSVVLVEDDNGEDYLDVVEVLEKDLTFDDAVELLEKP